jgi:hypothetical protein
MFIPIMTVSAGPKRSKCEWRFDNIWVTHDFENRLAVYRAGISPGHFKHSSAIVLNEAAVKL